MPLFANKKYNSHTTSKELKELEFLKKFRKAYESDLAQDQKHEIISNLFKEYHGLPLQKLASDWHLWDLKEISGISDSISKILFIEGIKSKQDVKMASDNALLNISGIGPERLRQIRAFFSRDILNKLYETKNDDNNKRTSDHVEIKDNCNKKKKIEPVEINIT